MKGKVLTPIALAVALAACGASRPTVSAAVLRSASALASQQWADPPDYFTCTATGPYTVACNVPSEPGNGPRYVLTADGRLAVVG